MTVLRKHLFELPEGVVYLDGNSLGPLPKGARARAQQVISKEWGQDLIRAWNSAGWMEMPQAVGDRLARLIGAPDGSVATGDTLSIKVFQALASALQIRPNRRVILSDSGNFPSDLYMAQGLLRLLDREYLLRTPPPEDVLAHITDEVAAVMLTHVDYKTGRMHDMARITEAAHDAGAVMIWDLAHSAGAVELDIAGSNAEFAVGCTYKYLNGGPGAPAFIYVRPDIVLNLEPSLAGWLGHAEPFAMDPTYRPAMSTERFRVGTPPVFQLAVLDHALDVWKDVDMAELRSASVALTEQFISEVEAKCPQVSLMSPRDASIRGSQVSFAFSEAYALVQAMIDRGVIGDFRAPNIARFGFTPLFIDASDVSRAVAIMQDVLETEAWREPKYQVRSRVT